MNENRINALIAITSLVAAAIMLAALSFAIGKWSLGRNSYDLVVKFPNASGINANSEVKFAGAKVGRVAKVRLIPRDKEDLDPASKKFNCVEVVVEIDKDIQIGNDATAIIKQDGIGIAAKYVLFSPGPDHDSPAFAKDAVVQGVTAYDLSDLLQPAGDTLAQVKDMVSGLKPVMARLDGLTQNLETSLPPLVSHADKFLQDGDGFVANLNSPESKERLNALMANLRVSTDNLKVVSSNAKALTATLAEKPWRVFWGGPTVPAPTEAQVLKSNQVIRLKPEVDVNAPPAKQ